jgi:hypothetical protein
MDDMVADSLTKPLGSNKAGQGNGDGSMEGSEGKWIRVRWNCDSESRSAECEC